MIGATQNQRGEFLQHNLNSPIQIRVGDTAVVVGNQLLITRDGQVVEVRTLGAESVVPLAATREETIDHVLYFKERKMPGVNVGLQRVTEQANGAVVFQFTSGTVTEYAGWADVGVVADEIDANTELCERILVGMSFRASPDGANKTTQVGAGVSVNLLIDTPVSYTGPV